MRVNSIEVGDEIPVFTLKDQFGNDFSLENMIGEKQWVLFFYPKDFTPGCVKEVCSFRDQYEVFKQNDVEVVGISSDSSNSHQKFAQKYKLPFIILADLKSKVRKLFGISNSFFGLLPKRITFVIDKKGIVLMRFENQFGAEKHIIESLKILNIK